MVDLNHLDRHIFSDRARHPAFYLVGHPDRGTQLAGRAIAALEAIMLDEGVLERKQMAGLSEAFNRSDRTILILHGQGEAGVDPFAVDQYRASSAGALVATLLGAGESQMFAEKIEQRSAYIRFEIEGLAIYKEMHGGLHGTVTPALHRAMKRRTPPRGRTPHKRPGSILCPSKQARRSQVLPDAGIWRSMAIENAMSF